MLQRLFLNVVGVSLSTSVLIAVLLLFLPFIQKRYTAKWRYFVWLIFAVRLLIPFSLSLPRAATVVVPISQSVISSSPVQAKTDGSFDESTPAKPAEGSPAGSSSIAASDPLSSKPRAITLQDAFPVLWLAGAILFMLYHWIGYLMFKRSVLRFSKPVEHPRVAELMKRAKEELGIGRDIRLLICKKIQSPMITGFFKPLLLMPDLDYDNADMQIIFKHELIHYRRGDIWYKLLMTLANAVHWFNPLVYLMAAKSNTDIEMACDFELVGDSDSAFRTQYSKVILSAIYKENQRSRTVFSTYFYGGEKAMEKRFANILDTGKKHSGTALLCAVMIIAGVAGSFVAYGVTDHTADAVIDNVTNSGSGYSYSLADGKFIISYGTENTTVVPLAPDTDDRRAYFADKAVYISDEMTAVAYGGQSDDDLGEAPYVRVLVSQNMGQTWNTYTVTNGHYETKFIGFTTKDDGWLVLCGDVAMGLQDNRIFQTSDGGKTWQEIGNTNDFYHSVVTGAGFADESIGFVSFRDNTDVDPVIYRTQDKGKTWSQCAIEIPDSFKPIASHATALSPMFNGAKGILPVTLRNNGFDPNGDAVDVTVWYETSDYGKTWTFDEQYNLALIWADAWKTRDGKARYEIMSGKLQAEFRARQGSPDDPDVIYYSIRWSSPWVVSYDITLDRDQAVITYLYTDSTTSTYKGVERLSFGKENSRLVVTASETEVEMEEYVDTTDWKTVKTDLFTFSMPGTWAAQMEADEAVGFTLAANGEQLGTLSILGYDSSKVFTQFIGNHAQILSTKTLDGCNYPATKMTVRRTRPAAAQDDSYVDELHIYLIPEDSLYAYDLCFTSDTASQKAAELARSLVIDTDLATLYDQILKVGYQWAAAVQKREGIVQYDLMSTALRESVYAQYEENHWVTGLSSPWVDSYRVKPGDNTAVVTYTYMTSDGFAGYYEQTLSFIEEDGRLVISKITDPQQPGGLSKGVVISYLEDRKTYLFADRLKNSMFSDMALSIDGRTKSFSWETCNGMAFLPELSYMDVDGDGQDELIIILCEGKGTGVLVEEIHVLNPEDFSEITVHDPLSALENSVRSTIDDDGLTISVDGENTLIFSKDELTDLAGESTHWSQNLVTGSVIDYSMEGRYIAVDIGAQISAAFLGNYHLTYRYEDDQLKISSISFSKNT